MHRAEPCPTCCSRRRRCFSCVFFLYPFVLVAVEAFTRDGAFTLEQFPHHGGHWKFPPAFRNTMLLAAVVVPIQLALALAMASIVTKLKTGRSAILYIFAIPLGISDLAAGLIWLAIFEQSGFLNTWLVGLGVVDQPVMFLGYQNKLVIFVAVVARRGLARHGDHDGDPRRRHGADPQGILRGGGSVRRRPVEALPQGDPADAAAQPADGAHPARHPRLRGLRRRRRRSAARTCRC